MKRVADNVIVTDRLPARCPSCARKDPTRVPDASLPRIVRVSCVCGWSAKYALRKVEQ